MSRGRLLALVLAPTLLIGLALGAFLVVDARQAQQDVAAADAAAADYQAALADYREAVTGDLEGRDGTEPGRIAEALAEHRDLVPELASTSQRGEEGSSRYQLARRQVAELAEARERLDDVVTEATTALAFVDAASTALEVDPQALAPGGTVTDGGSLRVRLLPPMRTALATFEAAKAPKDATTVRAAVRAALQHVIDEGEKLAADLDAGRSGSFRYGTEYSTAREAVRSYDDTVRADLREALDGVVADPSRQG